MTVGTFLVLQNAQPGRDQDHRAWYTSDHIRDVGDVPGMTRGVYARATKGLPTSEWLHLGYFLTDGWPVDILDEVLRRSFSGDWKLTDTLDFRGMMRSVGVLRGNFKRDSSDSLAVGNVVFVLLVNPLAGDTESMLRWCAGPRFSEAVSISGVMAGRAFELLPHPEIKKAYPYRFAIVCDLVSEETVNPLVGSLLGALVEKDHLAEPEMYQSAYTVEAMSGEASRL